MKWGSEPPVGGMRFGYRAHRDAGVPFRGERPIAELNEELEQRHISNRTHEQQLSDLLKDHPHLKERASELIRLRWPAGDLLHQLWAEARE